MNLNIVRKITIQGEAPGVEAATAAVRGLGAAIGQTATVTDVAAKRQLSAEAAYKRQTLLIDESARATDRYTRAVRVLDAAMAQGIVKTTTEYNQRLAMLQQRYGQVGNASETLNRANLALTKGFSAVQGAAGALGIGLGLAAMVSYGKAVFTATADLQEQTDQILGAGGNVEALQAIRGVWAQNGVEMGQGDRIVAKLTRTLGEAAEGSKTAQAAFGRLGLGARELAGRDGASALSIVVQKLLEVKDAQTRAAIESDLLGEKLGQKLEPALTALATPMDQLIARAKELGIVIDRDMIKKADDANDRMSIAFLKLSVAIAPIVTNWVDGFTKIATSVDGAASKLEQYLKYAGVAVSIYGGAKFGALFGPGGALVGGVAGGVAGLNAFGGTAIDAQIAKLNSKLADPNLGTADRRFTDYQVNQLYGMLPKLQPYTGSFTLGPAANDDSGNATWKKTQDEINAAAAAAKAAQAAQARIAASKEIKALDSDIAKAAQETVNFQLKQNELKDAYVRKQQQLADDTDDYLKSLQTEVDLAGMSREERETQAAILEGMRVSQGRLTEAQEDSIKSLIAARHEAEQFNELVTPLVEYPADLLQRHDVHESVKASIREIFL